MSAQPPPIGPNCAIYEFTNADIADNGTSQPILQVTGIPPTPGMQMYVAPYTVEGEIEYWPYLVYYCDSSTAPHGEQHVSVPLERDQVGLIGVQVVGDTLRLPLKVSFGSGE